MKKARLLIAIPAFNEEKMIGSVLRSLPKNIPGVLIHVLVVNDGSNDKTGNIAKRHKVKVLFHIRNCGLGVALGTAFVYARLHDYDIMVTFDADGQHKASDIQRLIKPILQKKADVVVGSRLLNGRGMPLARKVINFFSNIATLLLCNIWTTDSQSGLRAFSKKAIVSIYIKTQGMEVSSEIFREIHKNSLKVVEIPIEAIYTSYSLYKGQRIGNAFNVFWKLILQQFKSF